MSAPIDELLIAVRIEQGSNLMELYEMLRELQQSGGKIEAQFPNWFSHQAWNGLLTRLDNIRDCCKDIHQLFPQLEENLKTFLQQAITDMYSQLVDTILLTIENKFEPPIDSLRISLNDLSDYIEGNLMTQLSYIVEQLKKVEVDQTIFEEIERRIASLRKTFIEYGKKITAIKNMMDKYNYKIEIDTNRAKLDQIIENKRRFEPEVLKTLYSIEQKLKEPSKLNVEELKDYIASQVKMIAEIIPLDMEKFFSRVLKQVEDSEGNIAKLIEQQRESIQTIVQQPESVLVNPQLDDNDFDMFTSIVTNIIQAELYDLEESIKELDSYAHKLLEYGIFDDFRNEFREDLKSIQVADQRLTSIEGSMVDMWLQFNEFNKKKRWQTVVKEMLDRHFVDFEDNVAESIKEEMIAKFDEEFTELFRILNVLTNPEAMEELEQEMVEKQTREIGAMTSAELFDAMEKYEKEEKQAYLRGEGTRGDIEYRLSTQDRTLDEIDDKLDDVLDSLDDINPRGDEAKRTLDDDREKARKRREEPL